ncbi:MAG TPA: hypothetical protein VJJ98_03175 [Sedimentisphaerales bacterium]|nr:hypothetical protein [Sedimentisphaerales bacterium]
MKKLAIWLSIDLGVAVLVFILLLYRPGRYNPLSPAGFKPGQVSPYLTLFHSAVYNGAQFGEPFDVALSEEGLNDIVARGGLEWNWPLEHEGVMLYAPAAVLEPGRLVLMGTADVKGIELVVTIELESEIDEKGLLSLKVKKLKVGAMNITPLAKLMAKKMYAEQVAASAVDTEAWQTKIAASLLNDEPFDPVFPMLIDSKLEIRVRVQKVAIQEGKVSFRLIPVQ